MSEKERSDAEMKTPQQWAADRGMYILDPDGWRRRDAPPFDAPCTEAEFLPRFAQCTVGPLSFFGVGCTQRETG